MDVHGRTVRTRSFPFPSLPSAPNGGGRSEEGPAPTMASHDHLLRPAPPPGPAGRPALAAARRGALAMVPMRRRVRPVRAGGRVGRDRARRPARGLGRRLADLRRQRPPRHGEHARLGRDRRDPHRAARERAAARLQRLARAPVGRPTALVPDRGGGADHRPHVGGRRARTRQSAPTPASSAATSSAPALALGVVLDHHDRVGALIGARLDAIDLSIVVPLCLLALLGAGCGHPARDP